MARKHALLISLAVACALVAGVFAAVRTTELGASASTGTGLSDRQLTTRDRQLDKIAERIRAHARKRPPKLPGLRIPASASSGSVSSGSFSSGSGSGSSGSAPQLLISSSGSPSSGHHDDQDDHHGGHDDHDDSSGHGHGHGGDNADGSSGHGHGHGGDDDRDHD